MHEGLSVIEEEADRLNSLIDNLLDASRIQAGVFKLELGDVSLERLVQRVVEGFRLRPRHTTSGSIFHPICRRWWLTRRAIRQVLDNLMSNAIKYSPDGGTIRIGGWHDEQGVTIYVADQGIGIPHDEQGRLFESFYRVDSGLRRRTKGTGLGLYLSKTIIDAHDGTIWVRSEPGKGSTFFFTLPTAAGAE